MDQILKKISEARTELKSLKPLTLSPDKKTLSYRDGPAIVHLEDLRTMDDSAFVTRLNEICNTVADNALKSVTADETAQ